MKPAGGVRREGRIEASCDCMWGAHERGAIFRERARGVRSFRRIAWLQDLLVLISTES